MGVVGQGSTVTLTSVRQELLIALSNAMAAIPEDQRWWWMAEKLCMNCGAHGAAPQAALLHHNFCMSPSEKVMRTWSEKREHLFQRLFDPLDADLPSVIQAGTSLVSAELYNDEGEILGAVESFEYNEHDDDVLLEFRVLSTSGPRPNQQIDDADR